MKLLQWVYTIEREGYIDKNGKLLVDETSIIHQCDGEPSVDIYMLNLKFMCMCENGIIGYENYYYFMKHDKLIYVLNNVGKKLFSFLNRELSNGQQHRWRIPFFYFFVYQ